MAPMVVEAVSADYFSWLLFMLPGFTEDLQRDYKDSDALPNNAVFGNHTPAKRA